jgi:hypothetical protein
VIASHCWAIPLLGFTKGMNGRPNQHLGTPQGGSVLSLGSASVTFARELLDASPVHLTQDAAQVAAAIDACLTSAQACTACADADSIEHDLAELGTCIALNQECADVCTLRRGSYRDRPTGTTSPSSASCRPAPGSAACAPRSAPGTPTTATAPSASRLAAHAWRRAGPC